MVHVKWDMHNNRFDLSPFLRVKQRKYTPILNHDQHATQTAVAFACFVCVIFPCLCEIFWWANNFHITFIFIFHFPHKRYVPCRYGWTEKSQKTKCSWTQKNFDEQLVFRKQSNPQKTVSWEIRTMLSRWWNAIQEGVFYIFVLLCADLLVIESFIFEYINPCCCVISFNEFTHVL